MINNAYLAKHGAYPELITNKVLQDTQTIVVIPCYCEDNILQTLNSLRECAEPKNTAEVIVVINSSLKDNNVVIDKNRETEKSILSWIEGLGKSNKQFFVVNIEGISPKESGVGMARKIGMDEAVRRFEKIKNPQGVIVNLDADCSCNKNYFVAIEQHFKKFELTNGCSIYYEHPLKGEEFPNEVYEGIINYELFLRYHYQGLKFTGHPFIFQTVGSSMAVRSKIYQGQGGMNKRKAGEDFYFINKISQLGNYTNLVSTVVKPSPRLSSRVPFGTGKAIQDWLELGKIIPYHPENYVSLRCFFERVDLLYDKDKEGLEAFKSTIPTKLQEYLVKIDFINQVILINNNVASAKSFVKRFYKWFNPFILMKFLNFTRESEMNHLSLKEAAQVLLELKNIKQIPDTTKELLNFYRRLEKDNS